MDTYYHYSKITTKNMMKYKMAASMAFDNYIYNI